MKSWKNKRISDFFEVQSSKRVHKSDWKNSGIPFYRAREVVKLSNFGFVDNELFISNELYNEYTKIKGAPNEGDILVSAVGTLGKCYLVKSTDKFYFKDASVLWFKKINEINSRFILYVFNSFIIREQISQNSPGATVGTLTINTAKKINFPVPSFNEQERIVFKLDSLFDRIDKCIALLEENIKQTDLLVASSLDGIFDALSKKHLVEPLLKHVDFIGGSQPPKSKFSNEEKDGYVRLIQIRDYKSDNFIVYIDEKSTKKFCNADDVMIGRYGPPVFQILRGLEGAYNVALMKAVPDEKVITKDFLFYFLQNGKIQNYIISISQRSAGQSGVNKKALEKYEIVIPPLNIQKETVTKIKSLQNNLSKLQTEQQDKLTNLKALKESILDKAFKGEL